MKVNLEDIRIGISTSGECYAGILDKSEISWKHKKSVNNDFIHAVITRWKNESEVIEDENYIYEISVTKTPKKKKS